MGMFDQIKDAMKMRNEYKRIQNEMQKISVSYSNGGITAVAKGDMTISSITFAEGAYDEVIKGKPARFETMLLNVVNGALKSAKDATQAEMMKMVKAEGGIGGLFGK
jgi:DNA-binding protein YbaB